MLRPTMPSPSVSACCSISFSQRLHSRLTPLLPCSPHLQTLRPLTCGQTGPRLRQHRPDESNVCRPSMCCRTRARPRQDTPMIRYPQCMNNYYMQAFDVLSDKGKAQEYQRQLAGAPDPAEEEAQEPSSAASPSASPASRSYPMPCNGFGVPGPHTHPIHTISRSPQQVSHWVYMCEEREHAEHWKRMRDATPITPSALPAATLSRWDEEPVCQRLVRVMVWRPAWWFSLYPGCKH